MISRLKNHFSNALQVWPLETGWLEADAALPQILVSEVYPSLVQKQARPGQVKDESQVESLCDWFAEEDKSGRLVNMLSRPSGLTDEESREICSEEGWILGI